MFQTVQNIPASVAKRGRPRAFDRAKALRLAQHLIWEHGYEAVSLAQLEETMGIGKTSLYAAFGSKFALLQEAAALYIEEASAKIASVMDSAPTTIEAIHGFLDMCAHDFTDPARPHGCFLVSAATMCSPDNADAAAHLREGRAAVGSLIHGRINRGVEEGDIMADAPVATLVEYVQTVLHGMTIQARDGSSQGSLQATAALAITGLSTFRRAVPRSRAQ